MADSLYAIILGFIQGIAEFLPISSSAHLIVFSKLLGGEVIPLSLNVALHLGTLVAVLTYFFKDWWALVVAVWRRITGGKGDHLSDNLVPAIVLGTIPAGVIGLLFKDYIEATFHHPAMTAIPLAIVGPIMWAVDKYCPTERSYEGIKWWHGVIIGFFQATALIPGVSRSGATLVAGRLLGLDRVSAAKFSFLLGIPAMLGAFVLEAKEITSQISDPLFIWGFISSAVFGLLAIAFLLRFLRTFGLGSFAVYRVLLAAFIWYYLA